MISKLCQSQDWWISSLLSYSQPALNVATLPSQAVTLSLLHFILYLLGLEIVLCLWSVYRDRREGWAGCWGLIKQFWILTVWSRTIDIPHPSWWPTTLSSVSASVISTWIHIAPFSGTKLLNLALTGTYSKWKSSHTRGAVHKWGRVKTLQRRFNTNKVLEHIKQHLYLKEV